MEPLNPVQNLVQPKLTHQERLDVPETFADSLGKMTLEGFNAKLEFVVHRMDDPKLGQPPTGKSVSACRLVLPLPGIINLHGQLTTLINALQAQGVLGQAPTMPPMLQSGTVN